jgi:ribosome-binding factor A
MISQKQRNVRKLQREQLLLKAISEVLLRLQEKIPDLLKVSITHVKLSSDSSYSAIYFFSSYGEAVVKEIIEELKLYKNSIRASIASLVDMRRVPEIRFFYDKQHEKILAIESLIDCVPKD